MARPGFSFLVCPDTELTLLKLEELLAGAPGGDAYERRVYYAPKDDHDEPLPGQFWQDLDVPSLMGAPKFLILRRAHKQDTAFWKAMETRLAAFNDTVWPVFCLEGEWNKGKPAVPAVVSRRKFWPVARKKGWVWQMQGLTQATLRRMVESFATSRGLSISSDLVHDLAANLPLQAGAARRELEKIALAAGESGVVKPGHLSVVSHRPDMDIFSFVSAAVSGKSAEKVWAKVFAERTVGSDDKIFFGFLRLLHREARIFFELAAGDKPSVYVPRGALNDKTAMARRLGAHGVAAIFDLVMAAEFGVKSGARSPEQAFEALVAGLHQISTETCGVP